MYKHLWVKGSLATKHLTSAWLNAHCFLQYPAIISTVTGNILLYGLMFRTAELMPVKLCFMDFHGRG